MRQRCAVFLLLLLAASAAAQDERSVASPDGQLEFRLGLAQPADGGLFRLAYQVFHQARPLIATSFLGLVIWNQEPILGENAGLTSSRTSREAGYNTLIAEFMQNGSLGRRLNLEVRAANDGIAFRYVIPRTTPLQEILIEDELTEFDLAPAKVASTTLPFVAERPGVGWLEITEVGSPPYPRSALARLDATILVTHLPRRGDSPVAFQGETPLTCPWRVVIVARDRERLAQSSILKGLKP